MRPESSLDLCSRSGPWPLLDLRVSRGTAESMLSMLCGALLPSLPHLRQVLGGRFAVRRATLLSGQVPPLVTTPC